MILAHHVEPRASLLRVQVPVSYDKGVRISPVKLFQQTSQGNALRFRSRVHWLSVRRQTAYVADAYRVPVVVLAMRPGHFFRPAGFDCPVRRDDVVVSAAYPAKGTVVAVDVRHSQGTARPVGGTVHDN